MHHYEDFGVKAKWHYLATSHGKSACDGVGAVVKYQARGANLQRNAGNLITSAGSYSYIPKKTLQKASHCG